MDSAVLKKDFLEKHRGQVAELIPLRDPSTLSIQQRVMINFQRAKIAALLVRSIRRIRPKRASSDV